MRPVRVIRPQASPAAPAAAAAAAADRPFDVPRRPGVVRLGVVYPNLFVGGAEVWLRTLLRNLPHELVDVAGVAVSELGGLPTVDLAGARVTFDLAALLRACDVVIAWGVASAGRIREHFAGPVVYVGHSQPDQVSPANLRLAGEADLCVAVSEAARRGLPRSRQAAAAVIPNGVEPMPLPPREHARRWLRVGGRLAVGYVGRWSDEKNPLAAARAVAELPDAVAVYHGYRSHGEEAFRREVLRLTGGRAIFRTPAAPVAETYAAIDCFVHAPHSEAFGLTYCEAWQAGVPVVAADRGVVAESGQAARVAALVRPDAGGAELAAAVRAAIAGATVEPAKRLVAERYTAEAMGNAWGKLLHGAAPCP